MIDDEEQKKLENQEIWAKVFFNGYFCKFVDQMLAVDIRIENPDFPEKSAFKGTTQVFCPINADEEGNVDLTPLLYQLAIAIRENPTSKVRAFATGFNRQFHFNKDLLSTPAPKDMLDIFSK
jgi:hypothetical protein